MDQAEQKEPSETLTRRTFLESAALGGTALLASQIAPIAAYGRNFFPLQPSTGHHEDQRRDVLSLSPLGSVTIQGWIGNRIELCVNNRVMAQSVSDLIEPYRSHADGDGGFRGEYRAPSRAR